MINSLINLLIWTLFFCVLLALSPLIYWDTQRMKNNG